jgi:hypothetical protein
MKRLKGDQATNNPMIVAQELIQMMEMMVVKEGKAPLMCLLGVIQ